MRWLNSGLATFLSKIFPIFLYCKIQYSFNRKQILYGQTHAENKQFVVEDLHGDVLILR